jgi:hypothetical protein
LATIHGRVFNHYPDQAKHNEELVEEYRYIAKGVAVRLTEDDVQRVEGDQCQNGVIQNVSALHQYDGRQEEHQSVVDQKIGNISILAIALKDSVGIRFRKQLIMKHHGTCKKSKE